jgi:ubiquinol-cytochrome c reductase cytochrome b subunit
MNAITWVVRIGIFVFPVVTYIVTKRICLGLQLRDRDKLLHGRETGRIKRLPHGEFVEVHERLDREREYTLLSRGDFQPPAPPSAQRDGVANPKLRHEKLRYWLSRWLYGGQVPIPTPEELQAAWEEHQTDTPDEIQHADEKRRLPEKSH